VHRRPNGCGKSGVVDAISWVLGEQSHKSPPRGARGDCIFKRHRKRPPMGLAEVTITMEDPELARPHDSCSKPVQAADALEEKKKTMQRRRASPGNEFFADVPAQPSTEEGCKLALPLSTILKLSLLRKTANQSF
jgi:hypothetical protein